MADLVGVIAKQLHRLPGDAIQAWTAAGGGCAADSAWEQLVTEYAGRVAVAVDTLTTEQHPPGRQWTIQFRAPAPWVNTNEQRSGARKTKINQTQWIALWRDAGHKHALAAGLRKSRAQLQVVEIAAVVRFPNDHIIRDAPNTYPSVKAAVDGALVDTGVLPDDNDKHVTRLCISPGPPIPVRPYQPAGELQITVREVL